MPGGQHINHFGTVRIRVTGAGNLKCRLISMDTTTDSQLTDVVMQSQSARYPNQLANFNQQKAQLELKTTELNETFLIRQILVYVKPVASSFPQ
jgi:hypothetical protein